MTTQIVENLELFSEAQLESLEFLPEELENIEFELYPSLESISPEQVAKDLEAYFEGGFEEAGLERLGGRGGRGGARSGRSPSFGRGRTGGRSGAPGGGIRGRIRDRRDRIGGGAPGGSGNGVPRGKNKPKTRVKGELTYQGRLFEYSEGGDGRSRRGIRIWTKGFTPVNYQFQENVHSNSYANNPVKFYANIAEGIAVLFFKNNPNAFPQDANNTFSVGEHDLLFTE
jgi:hypothetical protein